MLKMEPSYVSHGSLTFLYGLSVYFLCCVYAVGSISAAERYQYYIGSERYSPEQEDTYCSTYIPFSEPQAFATRFSANASQQQVHHMILNACYGQPSYFFQPSSEYAIDSERGIYGGCGKASFNALSQACTNSQIMFAWARNAPPVQLPDDVSYPIGQRAGMTHLLLQVHYAVPAVEDTSGVLIDLQHTPTHQAAGVLLLGSSGGSGIPARSDSINMFMSCQYNSDVPIHPFAFRTHAHDLGRVIAGFVDHGQSGSPQMFARGDPRLPQFFYPLHDKSVTISRGDAVAAVCNFNASSREHATYVGATHSDEMCNLYIMYSYDMNAVEPANENDDDGFRAKRRANIQRECFNDQLGYSRYLNSATANLQLTKAEQQALLDDAYGKNSGITVDSVTGGSMMGGGHMHHHHDEEMVMPANANSMPSMQNMPKMQPKPQHQPLDTMQTDSQHATGAVIKKAGVVTAAPPHIDVTEAVPHVTDQSLSVSSSVSPQLKSPAPLSSTNYTAIPNWFDYSQLSSGGKVGQIAGMSYNIHTNRLLVFHRSTHTWGSRTFDPFSNLYMEIKAGPIAEAAVVEIDPENGRILERWGEQTFYIPHSITVDHQQNVWLTDVALHQVMKFDANNKKSPSLVLGQKFRPGKDEKHFCKPTDVVVLPKTNEFFVSDGYCNSRVVKFSSDGRYLGQIGSNSGGGSNAGSLLNQFIDKIPSPSDFEIPHSLALDQNGDFIFVADRENGRIQVFRTDGKMDFVKSLLLQPFMGTAMYAVDSRSNALVAVNGKLQLGAFVQRRPQANMTPILGAIIDAAAGAGGAPLAAFGKGVLRNPHCVAFGKDLQDVFVGEIGPNRLWRFTTKPVAAAAAAVAVPQPAEKQSEMHATTENLHANSAEVVDEHENDHDDMNMNMNNMPSEHDHEAMKSAADTTLVHLPATDNNAKHDDAVQPPVPMVTVVGVDGDKELLGSGMATMVTLMFLLVPLALICMGLMYWKTRREQRDADAALGGHRTLNSGGGDEDEEEGLSGVSVKNSRAARRLNERANGTSNLQHILSKQKGFAPVPTHDAESHDFRASDFDDDDDDDDDDAGGGDTEELFNRKTVGQSKGAVRKT